MPDKRSDKVGAVLVVGAGISGMQSSLDLADGGFKVYLLDKSPAIGGTMAQLDKTFPTNDCAMCIMAPKLVEVGRHPNIELLTYSTLEELKGQAGNFNVKIKKHNRYVDVSKCTGCTECESVCPVEVKSEFNENLSNRHAIYRKYPQAIPNAYSIEKLGISPCRDACPAGVKCQGYVALISQKKYKEALECIRETLPFPSICGRVCHHPCEEACNRKEVDEPIAIRPLKRFISDWMIEHGEESPTPIKPDKKDKVAIIGAGPGGLTCALRLLELGYPVTVFDSSPESGGMITNCLPEYRIPKAVANHDINRLLALGIEVRNNTTIGKDIYLDDLRKEYKAIFIAIGSQNSAKLDIQGTDLNGVLLGLPFLREAKAGKTPVGFGKNIAIIGGGNVAIDCAKTATRLGAENVTIVCLETRDLSSHDRMPAYEWEVEEAEEEGVKIHDSLGPQEIVGTMGKVIGLKTIKCLSVYDEHHKFSPNFSNDSGPTFDVDTIILAIGQRANLTGLNGIEQTPWKTIKADKNTLQTSIQGIFAGGDIVRGPASVIEAVADGNKAAIYIDRYLRGLDLIEVEGKTAESVVAKLPKGEFEKIARKDLPKRAPIERAKAFDEIELNYDEETAVSEAQRCINCAVCSECLQCVDVCKAEAIDHEMQEEIIDLNIGSIIVSPGFKEFNPEVLRKYGYGTYPNVISSIQFERILSASGPFAGHVKRISDGREPKKVAFIQCVGSRDRPPGKPYCSSVCCMYAIKEAIIAKEHTSGLEPTIFFMDMRAFGKEFDDYYIRAEKEHKIRFIRNNRISTISEDPVTHNLIIPYIEEGELRTEEFDLVVLSVGLTAPEDAKELSRVLGIELNQFDFCAKNSLFSPLETTRPGIYIAGSFSAPKDIPDCVSESSGAAGKASSIIASERGKSIVMKKYPNEREIKDEEPRIGVFVCHCGINIGGVVNVPEVVRYAEQLPNVVYAEDNLYTCSDDTQKAITKNIQEYNLNRVVVASCTPRTHQPLFQNTLKEAGLNPYLFEMANIRDQCSWVHMHEPEAATEKAKDLVRIAVAKSTLLGALKRVPIDIKQTSLIIGGGLTGMTAALELSKQGYESYLVEKEAELGGLMRRIHHEIDYERGIEKRDIQQQMKKMIEEIKKDKKIHLFINSTIKNISGYIGNFTSSIQTKDDEKEIEHGTIIVATGGNEYLPNEYLYGQTENVLTQLELEEKLSKGAKFDANTIVMIQCVGSRNTERPYCSRVCCTEAIKNAIKIKELNPKAVIYILFRDMRTYGFRELLYEEAARLGIKFIRYDEETIPKVNQNNREGFEVRVKEHFINQEIVITADLLVLSVATIPHQANIELAKMLKVPLSKDKLFLEAHMKLRPVEFATDGIYLCGLAHSPKFFEECVAQANAAVSRTLTIISKDKLESEAMVAVVDQDKCCGCRTCEGVCAFNAQIVNKTDVGWKAEVIAAACKGCGSCATACPENAITILNFTDEQLISAGIAALREAEGISLPTSVDDDVLSKEVS